MKKLLLAILFTTAVTNVQAASLSSETLPYGLQTELQGCADMGCEVIPESLVDIGGMSAYAMINPYAADPITWLIRYNLTAPSNKTSSYADLWDYNITTTTTTPLSGSIWLRASNTYNPADAYHPFSVYIFDTVTPSPHYYYMDYSINLSLTTNDLLAGGGYALWTYWDYSEGNLKLNMPFWSCIECGGRLDFNLIYLDYSSGTLNFNPNDKRGLLFAQSDFFDYYWSNKDQFYVQPVPIPPALLLFGSGLLGLFGLTKQIRRVGSHS